MLQQPFISDQGNPDQPAQAQEMTFTTNGKSFFIASTAPKIVGYWVMPGGTKSWYTKFAVYTKPRWHVRKMMLWIFGWDWEPEKDTCTN